MIPFEAPPFYLSAFIMRPSIRSSANRRDLVLVATLKVPGLTDYRSLPLAILGVSLDSNRDV